MDKRIDCNSCPLRCIETDSLCEQYCSDMADFIDEIRADVINELVDRFHKFWDDLSHLNVVTIEEAIDALNIVMEEQLKGAENDRARSN